MVVATGPLVATENRRPGGREVPGRSFNWLLALLAGHVSPEMTRRYVDLAAIVRGKVGTPHPKLFASLRARRKAGLFRVA